MEFTVDGVKVITDLDVDEVEARKYIDYVKNNVPKEKIDEVGGEVIRWAIEIILCDDGKIDLNYSLNGEKFERIRRITGKKIAVCC